MLGTVQSVLIFSFSVALCSSRTGADLEHSILAKIEHRLSIDSDEDALWASKVFDLLGCRNNGAEIASVESEIDDSFSDLTELKAQTRQSAALTDMSMSDLSAAVGNHEMEIRLVDDMRRLIAEKIRDLDNDEKILSDGSAVADDILTSVRS